jgi:hypothetical protein
METYKLCSGNLADSNYRPRVTLYYVTDIDTGRIQPYFRSDVFHYAKRPEYKVGRLCTALTYIRGISVF